MTTANSATALVADLGATNARFALIEDGRIGRTRVLACADYPTLAAAMNAYLELERPEIRPSRAAVAIACPVTGDLVTMTNHAWSFSIRELKGEMGFGTLEVLNDFTAVALSMPELGLHDRRQVGPGDAIDGEVIGVIGPGTGLGVSGLVRVDLAWKALSGEGGHVTMPATDAREEAILACLRHRFGHVSAERVLSGMGLTNLHWAIERVDGASSPRERTPKEVTDGAAAGEAVASEAVEIFCGMLGTVAGNLALTLGSRGGVFIAGGIVPRLGERFDRSSFRRRFEAKGRLASFVAEIPTYVVTNPFPAFLGLRTVI